MMDEYEQDLEKEANDIINQLKNSSKSLKKMDKTKEYENLSKEEVDDFITQQAANVIRDASEVLTEMKDMVTSGCSPNDAIAFAEVLKSFTSAVEILSKRQIASEKNKTQKEIKTMEIESKKEITQEENTNKLLLSQNDILKQMITISSQQKINVDDSNIIDV